MVVAAGFGFHLRNSRGVTAQVRSVASFVGSETCAGCHQAQARLWDASQHKAAMQYATGKTVLGDFNYSSAAQIKHLQKITVREDVIKRF
jgi:hypothetical protein